jgi:hypothetical protein
MRIAAEGAFQFLASPGVQLAASMNRSTLRQPADDPQPGQFALASWTDLALNVPA